MPEGSSYVDPLTGSTIYGEIHPAYSYVFNGETFDEHDPYHLPNDMSAHDIRSLKLGDKVNFYVNYKGDTKYREDYHMPIILLITGVLMFVVGSKAIKGYFNDFIIRYKKTHIICLTYLVLYALFTYWCNVNSGGMFDFGGSLIIWLLGTGISIVFLAVVWIVSVVKYHSANK